MGKRTSQTVGIVAKTRRERKAGTFTQNVWSEGEWDEARLEWQRGATSLRALWGRILIFIYARRRE